jgi:hypothetical protein
MRIYTEKKEGSSIHYNIFEDYKVECYINQSDFIDDIIHSLDKKKIYYKIDFVLNIINKYFPNERIWGFAKCHPDDTFDKEKGKALARARLLKKYYKIRTNVFRDIAEDLDKQLTYCEDCLNYSWLSYLDHNKNS